MMIVRDTFHAGFDYDEYGNVLSLLLYIHVQVLYSHDIFRFCLPVYAFKIGLH